MAQQTAVEWLVEQLIPKAFVTYDVTTHNAIQQAKQMEKEQIIKAHNNAVVSPYTDLYAWETNGKSQITKGEQYYDETYGKE